MASLTTILQREIGKVGKSKTYVATELGVGEKTIENYMRGLRSPKPEVIVHLSRILGFDLNELSDEASVNEQIVPRGKKETDFIVRRRQQKNSDTDARAPLIPIKAQAGYAKAFNTDAYIEPFERYSLPPRVKPGGGTWTWWEIEGDSMIPVLKNQQIILTNRVVDDDWKDIPDETICVIVSHPPDAKIVVKRVYKKSHSSWYLISENENDKANLQRVVNFSDIKEVWRFRRKLEDELPPSRKIKIKTWPYVIKIQSSI